MQKSKGKIVTAVDQAEYEAKLLGGQAKGLGLERPLPTRLTVFISTWTIQFPAIVGVFYFLGRWPVPSPQFFVAAVSLVVETWVAVICIPAIAYRRRRLKTFDLVGAALPQHSWISLVWFLASVVGGFYLCLAYTPGNEPIEPLRTTTFLTVTVYVVMAFRWSSQLYSSPFLVNLIDDLVKRKPSPTYQVKTRDAGSFQQVPLPWHVYAVIVAETLVLVNAAGLISTACVILASLICLWIPRQWLTERASRLTGTSRTNIKVVVPRRVWLIAGVGGCALAFINRQFLNDAPFSMQIAAWVTPVCVITAAYSRAFVSKPGDGVWRQGEPLKSFAGGLGILDRLINRLSGLFASVSWLVLMGLVVLKFSRTLDVSWRMVSLAAAVCLILSAWFVASWKHIRLDDGSMGMRVAATTYRNVVFKTVFDASAAAGVGAFLGAVVVVIKRLLMDQEIWVREALDQLGLYSTAGLTIFGVGGALSLPVWRAERNMVALRKSQVLKV